MRSRTRDPDALAYLRLVGLGAVIGIPAALLAADTAMTTRLAML